MTRSAPLLLAAAALLAACQPDSPATPSGDGPADPPSDGPAVTSAEKGVPLPDPASTEAYDGLRTDEVLRFTGTEPFWGGEVGGGSLTYSTPENQDGTRIAVERFAGRGGVSFSGTLEGAELAMTVTPLACSDGMSDRTYPFTVTLKLGDETRNGCGWTERQPFEGPANP